jgi:hypothetical protein
MRMASIRRCGIMLFLASLAFLPAVVRSQPPAKALELHARRHVETKAGSKEFRPRFETLTWDAAKTAIVVCDMWDKHWCPAATGRV